MRTFITALAMLGIALLLTTGTNLAQDKKEEKKETVLKGKICCAKCELSIATDCETVIVVKDAKKKDIIYYFDKASHAKYHDDICTAAKSGTVIGTVKDEGKKKKVVSAKKVTYE